MTFEPFSLAARALVGLGVLGFLLMTLTAPLSAWLEARRRCDDPWADLDALTRPRPDRRAQLWTLVAVALLTGVMMQALV